MFSSLIGPPIRLSAASLPKDTPSKPLASFWLPVTSVPIKFPTTMLSAAPIPAIRIPVSRLPEIKLPTKAGAGPPIRFDDAPRSLTPLSLVLVTPKTRPSVERVDCVAQENSDVLPDGSLAVAVTNWPAGSKAPSNSNTAVPLSLVVTFSVVNDGCEPYNEFALITTLRSLTAVPTSFRTPPR